MGSGGCALAPLTDVSHATTALAQALGVREEEGVGVDQALAARLEGRRTLLLLDNAEHLLPDLAELVARLVEASERLTVLVTSRERLQLASENVFDVPTLSAEDAVAFLQERAAVLGLPLERSKTLDALCERLDRLPLALQLAAARLRTFSPSNSFSAFRVASTCSRGAATSSRDSRRSGRRWSGAMSC